MRLVDNTVVIIQFGHKARQVVVTCEDTPWVRCVLLIPGISYGCTTPTGRARLSHFVKPKHVIEVPSLAPKRFLAFVGAEGLFTRDITLKDAVVLWRNCSSPGRPQEVPSVCRRGRLFHAGHYP